MIFLFEKRISEKGIYITNINSTFEELFYNGTLYQEDQTLMQGVTLSGIINSINNKASESNVNVSITNPILSVTQEDPWNVKMVLTTDIFIKDKSNLALWNKTLTTIAYIPITNFEDPLYIISTNGKVANNINRSVNQTFVVGSDVSNLLDHVTKSYYINSSLAPSFLDRLQGINNPNPNGIESLVYLPKLVTQGIPIDTKSAVDYIYFSSNNPTSFQILGMPSWFRIDDNHLDIYQVSGLTI